MLRLVSIFLCLVLLILPSQSFNAQIIPTKSSTSCCKTKESKDCCKTNSPKEKQSHTNDCQDCCGTLHSCSGCYVFLFKNTSHEEDVLSLDLEKKQNFRYTTPFLVSLADTIWQPPKII